jgi:hypothetical protein
LLEHRALCWVGPFGSLSTVLEAVTRVRSGVPSKMLIAPPTSVNVLLTGVTSLRLTLASPLSISSVPPGPRLVPPVIVRSEMLASVLAVPSSKRNEKI